MSPDDESERVSPDEPNEDDRVPPGYFEALRRLVETWPHLEEDDAASEAEPLV